MTDKYDLIIIGAGPGGYEAAISASRLGLKTALIEKDLLGGTCLNHGCIPTKTLLHTAELYHQVRNAGTMGITAQDLSWDMEQLHNYKDTILEQMRAGIEALLKVNKVTVIRGVASIVSIGHVYIRPDNILLEAKNILIATGSVPYFPSIPGANLPGVFSSDQLLEKKEVFNHLAIIGGGVIGMEFASIYSSLGLRVTVIEAMDRILANMDKDIAQNLKMILKKRGVEIHTSACVEKITQTQDGSLSCWYTEKNNLCEHQVDGILMAVGRRPHTWGLIDENASSDIKSMAVERGRILIDSRFHTSIPGIYAIGDVTEGCQLAHAAISQGRSAAAVIAGKEPSYELAVIPRCIYTNPEIGCTGLTADEAMRQGIETLTLKYPMNANGKTILSGQERGFIKIVIRKDSHQILGAQMMCARATDMISQFSSAIVNQLTLEDLKRVVFPHPTFSEGIGEALFSS